MSDFIFSGVSTVCSNNASKSTYIPPNSCLCIKSIQGYDEISIYSFINGDLKFKSLKEGSNITIDDDGQYITIGSSGTLGPTNLYELNDVTISSLLTNQVLRYNGTSWVNATLNYLTTESDPIANAKTITVTGSSDIIVTGGLQAIGSNPVYNLAMVNPPVYTTNIYNDPVWLNSLAGSKIIGNISGNAGTVTDGVYTTGSYANPSWITALAWSKITGTPTTLSGYGITDSILLYSTQSLTSPQQTQARTNLGLGTISTQNSNAVSITGGTINNTSIGATTRSTGAFTTISANTSFSLITTGSSTGIIKTISSGLLYTSFGSLSINMTAAQNFSTNNGTTGSSGVTNILYVRENGSMQFNSFDKFPNASSAISGSYPTPWSTGTTRFNELIRFHSPYVANQFGLGDLSAEVTLQLGTVDNLYSNLYSKIAYRHGHSVVGGFTEYFPVLYQTGVMRVGPSSAFLATFGTYGHNVSTTPFGNSNTGNANSSYIAFNNTTNQSLGIWHTSMIDQVASNFQCIAVRTYYALTVASFTAVAGSKLQKWQVGNGANSYTTVATMEGNGALRLASNLEVGIISASGYAGGEATDRVRLYVRGALGDDMLVLEGTATNSLPGTRVQLNKITVTNNTATTLHTFTTATDTTYRFVVWVSARRTGGIAGTLGDAASWIMTWQVSNIGGVLTSVPLASTPTQWDTRKINALLDCTMDISGTNVRVRFTGDTNNNYSAAVDKFEFSKLAT